MALMPVVARIQGSAQVATPATAMGDGSLAAMLALAPDVLAGGAPRFQIAQYANPALQFETLGIASPQSIDDDEAVSLWVRASWWMALPDQLRTRALLDDWRATFGFDVFQVDQSLVAGEPPSTQTIYRGRFDVDELRAAWTASGYSEVDIDGAEAYSLSEDGSIDLRSAVAQLALAQMNNAAILPDGTLLFSSTLEELRTTVAAASGESATLAERPEIASLVATLDPTITSGFLVPGAALRATPIDIIGRSGTPEQIAAIEEIMAEIDAGQEPMPRPLLAAIGITAGGPLPDLSDDSPATPTPGMPLARDIIVLLMDDQAAAEAAIPIIENRLATGISFATNRPYRDYFADWELSIAGSEPVVLLNLTPAADVTPDIIFTQLARQDLLFVGWRDDEATPTAR